MPALAMPGLPAAITQGVRAGAAMIEPAPLRITVASNVVASCAAAAKRSASIVARCAAEQTCCFARMWRQNSPLLQGEGWVRMVFALAKRFGTAKTILTPNPLLEGEGAGLRASASMTQGWCACNALRSTARPHSPCPSPGPSASTEARSSIGARSSPLSIARVIASGRAASKGATCSARVPTLTPACTCTQRTLRAQAHGAAHAVLAAEA